MDIEVSVHRFDIFVGGVWGDFQMGGDLVAAVTLNEEIQGHALARGKPLCNVKVALRPAGGMEPRNSGEDDVRHSVVPRREPRPTRFAIDADDAERFAVQRAKGHDHVLNAGAKPAFVILAVLIDFVGDNLDAGAGEMALLFLQVAGEGSVNSGHARMIVCLGEHRVVMFVESAVQQADVHGGLVRGHLQGHSPGPAVGIDQGGEAGHQRADFCRVVARDIVNLRDGADDSADVAFVEGWFGIHEEIGPEKAGSGEAGSQTNRLTTPSRVGRAVVIAEAEMSDQSGV
jgi:hypothetical protein